MADKPFHSNIDLLGVSEIKNGGFEKLATDPTTPTEGQSWVNTTENKSKVYIGGTVYTVASESWVTDQINNLERFQGAYDASGGGLPTAGDKTEGDTSTLIAGDSWVITNGGTITGIQGDDVLAIGDKIEFLGGTATDPNSWVGIQRNLDDGSLGGGTVDRQIVSLVAGTPLTVSSSLVADIHSIQVYDSTGRQIELCVEKNANANQRVLESTVTAANVVVELTGV